MDQNSFSLFKVDAARIRESLLIVADSIERITTASDDAITNRDHYESGNLWETRELAGRHVFRLAKLLNRGSVELTDCDDKTIDTLRAVWRSIERLRFGDHCEVPENYCGALCLPGEIGPDHRQRLVDEPYALLSLPPELKESAVVKKLARQSTAEFKKLARQLGASERQQELASLALTKLDDWNTTTQERWGRLPEELRQYAEKLQAVDSGPIERNLAGDPAVAPDGPLSNRRWQYRGRVLPGHMTQQVHKLASYLFQFKDLRDVPFDELINKGVFAGKRPYDDTITRHGSNVTKWFKDQEVPLRVSSTKVDRTMNLCSVSPDGT